MQNPESSNLGPLARQALFVPLIKFQKDRKLKFRGNYVKILTFGISLNKLTHPINVSVSVAADFRSRRFDQNTLYYNKKSDITSSISFF